MPLERWRALAYATTAFPAQSLMRPVGSELSARLAFEWVGSGFGFLLGFWTSSARGCDANGLAEDEEDAETIAVSSPAVDVNIFWLRMLMTDLCVTLIRKEALGLAWVHHPLG